MRAPPRPFLITTSIALHCRMSNLTDQTECVPIAELKQLKLEEKPETTTTTTTIANVDIISTLPDSLLCHILSFLPTRTSVATSGLSRRWRHLWRDLQVLDLVDEFLVEPYYSLPPGRSAEDAEFDFVDFVDNVLDQVRHIQKFRLSCDILYNLEALEDWINAVTGPQLQELYLNLWSNETIDLAPFRLPHGIFTCTSLVSLTLENNTFVEKLQSVHLPSLKNLKLEVDYVNLHTILSGCPALEALNVHLYSRYVYVGGPLPQPFCMPHSLKSLTFEDDGDCEAIEHHEIDTPSLEYLDICTCYLGILVSNFPNMMEARLNICFKDVHVDWIPKVLKALCNTRMLLLKYSTMQCLLHAPALDIPEFSSLLRLEIEFPCFSPRFLLDMLQNCHRLQVLIIQYNSMKSSEASSDWPVPNCVISHLNIVEFRGYQDSAEEHEFTAYILQKGLVLKTMTIHTCSYSRFDQEKKDRILMELSTITRGSSICQLKLD